MPELHVKGHRVSDSKAGSGEPLVLLRGGGRGRQWRILASVLADRFTCMRFAADAVRLQLHLLVLAQTPATILQTLAMLDAIERWSLTSRREWLIKIGTRSMRHAGYAVFELAEATPPRARFAGVRGLINGPSGPPVGALCP